MSDTNAQIANNVTQILQEIPEHVTLVAAGKGRSNAEIQAAIQAGICHVGHNYVQEAQAMIAALADQARWHMIGHLQRNKVKYAIQLFDMIESLDSWRLAKELEKRCGRNDQIMPVLIEINSGKEESKTGILPGQLMDFVERAATLPHIRIQGLMTMGPRFGDPELARPYFQSTRKAFDQINARNLPNVEMRILSMGMSNSYRIAIEEGANMIRIGTRIFGERPA